MRRNRKVKILATLGPSSSDKDMIARLHQAGADCFRINMSHTNHEKLRYYVSTIREVEAEAGRPIGILADLQGPKLRVGTFANGPVFLEIGAKFAFHREKFDGDVTGVTLPHPEIIDALEPGHRLLIDDGRLRLRIVKNDRKKAIAEVEVGGKISDRKGVSLPDTILTSGALTEKDRADLTAALDADVDWIALSFVQRPEDLQEVHEIVDGKCGVMAKIEKPQAVERFNEILELSDAIMVARGDLGVELPLEQVPSVQKSITRTTRKAGKPVVVATQMLESMIQSPVPTRAEVSDIANAVFEGADAVMLSAESAAGAYPVEAVQTMSHVAEEVESSEHFHSILAGQRGEPDATPADAISASARQIAETLGIAALVCFTASGATGLRAARERPSTPILALSPNRSMARRLALVWGIHSVVTDDARSLMDLVQRASRISAEEGFAKPGDRIIITAGVPFGTAGVTNLLRIATIGADGKSGI
ncbi:pyruvate kinase [Pleomorphomonas carboxyditropha]|uniref:Pyruvate kinase n=1 Tax=Pleomorphomonas carboxyditropha TaxID=2023338 RepID=A0A2G9WRH5_9HYPH|nr:pyruvate kinase [Pleomorphomonas carboxyditropha]PIO96740.1 pyruvate kinase [Pleomorphomonas carboxyditropha]